MWLHLFLEVNIVVANRYDDICFKWELLDGVV